MESLICSEDLTLVYGNKDNSTIALNSVNISFGQNEIVSIVGPSGSGKSSLLHLLSGIEKPTAGRVLYNDINLSGLSDKDLSILRLNEFGFVFQFFNLIPNLTVIDNILLPIVLNKKGKTDNEFLELLVNRLGLKGKEYSLPTQMSGGEQQRVAIARALIHKPRIIFADEPTGNLDSTNGKMIFELLIKCVHEFNQTLIYVTHDTKFATIADRMVTIIDGVIKYE
jgi:putative ABC transport system ATP-binding protein